MISDYHKFLERKAIIDAPTGIPNPRGISKSLFDFQSACVKWMLQRGRGALFMGIGSEGYVSIEHCRKFIGFELKESYYKQAIANLAIAQSKSAELSLF